MLFNKLLISLIYSIFLDICKQFDENLVTDPFLVTFGDMKSQKILYSSKSLEIY